MAEQVKVWVQREYDIPSARAAAKEVSQLAPLSYRKCHHLMTAVSELANNLCFHTIRGGTIVLSIVRRGHFVGIEVVAEDDGPGISDINAAMQDGFSTNGGLGGGLPGVRRLMDEFEIVSVVGQGTQVVARIWKT